MSENNAEREITEADAARMADMQRAGLSLGDIADAYGITAVRVFEILEPSLPAEKLNASRVADLPAGMMAALPAEPRTGAGIGGTKRRRIIIAGICAIVLAAGGIIGGIELSQPSYRYSWCAPVESAMNNTHQTQSAYLAELNAAGPPATALYGAVQNFVTAYGAEQSASDLGLLTAIANVRAALNQVGDQLRTIDNECGVPASDAGHQAD